MRRNFRRGTSQLLTALIAGLLVPVCFAGKVQIWMEKGTNLSQYKTYEWLPPKILGNKGVVENDPEFSNAIPKPSAGRRFTLIEFLVVLAIIALLIAFLLPAVRTAGPAARRPEPGLLGRTAQVARRRRAAA